MKSKIFFIELDFIKKKEILKIYLGYIIFIAISSIVFSFLYVYKFPDQVDNNKNIILVNIPFFFGDLINNLVNKNLYVQKIYDIDFHLARHPFLPVFLSILFKVSKNIFFIITTKNIIIFSLYFYCCYNLLLKNKNTIFLFLITLLVPIIIPYNFNVALNYVYEDNLIAIFLPLLFLSLISNNQYKMLFAGFFLFFLYFIKGTTFFLVIFLSLFILKLDKNFKFSKLPFLSIILAITIWGSFGYIKTSKFPFLNTLESTNSYHLHLVLNKDFQTYYPNLSVDLLEKKPEKKINTEWEFYDYYYNKNLIFLKQNQSQYFRDIFLKLKFIFFGIIADGHGKLEKDSLHLVPIRVSSIFSKFFFNVAILIALHQLIKNKKKLEIYFLLITTLYLLPLIIAWATTKHLVPLFNVSLIYLLFKLNFYINKIK
jgi:hypothetical protein